MGANMLALYAEQKCSLSQKEAKGRLEAIWGQNSYIEDHMSPDPTPHCKLLLCAWF